MRPLDQRFVTRLPLSGSLEAEVASGPNLLPETPLPEGAESRRGQIVPWIANQLQAGFMPSTPFTVGVRKASHGVRPVPILGLPERIVYRALTDRCLEDEPPLDRSSQAYLAFVGAPVYDAGRRSKGDDDELGAIMRIFSSPKAYVVKADISSFYQYVDHEILRNELLIRGIDFDRVAALIEFLNELLGRSFGLPQLHDSSDRLSEVYIEILERHLLRSGFPTWHFNDDLRISCDDYPETLRAIEALEEGARALGLSLNETKTTPVKFSTYAFEVLGLRTDDPIPTEPAGLPEELVVEYTDIDETENAEASLELIKQTITRELEGHESALPRHEQPVSLIHPSAVDVGRLRRALGALVRTGNPGAVGECTKLIVYVPFLTPRIVTYLISAYEHEPELVARQLTEIFERVSLSAWQVWWLVRASRRVNLFRTGTGNVRTYLDLAVTIQVSTAWL
jgi:hypothetical protein